jgi:hypothetical protein
MFVTTFLNHRSDQHNVALERLAHAIIDKCYSHGEFAPSARVRWRFVEKRITFDAQIVGSSGAAPG